MNPQKFHRGDLVHITADLGPYMSHFTAGCDAIVMGSYCDQFGGEPADTISYTLLIDGGEVSWYYQDQLTFKRHVGEEGIQAAKAECEKRTDQESDLDWILSNWPVIRLNTPGATMEKLMLLVGITNPWGEHGEGIVWYAHAKATRRLLDPILQTQSRAKLEEFISSHHFTVSLTPNRDVP